jgi:hypothetical protein
VLPAALGAAALFAAPVLSAQTAPTACDGRPIRSVRVEAISLFVPGDPDVLGIASAAGSAIHRRTREDVVRRELLFRAGDACDPARLAETARALRAQPYIRDVTILALPSGEGRVDVLVTTRDEWSLQVGFRAVGGQGFPLQQLRVSEENVLGEAVRAQLRYDLMHRRPSYDADVTAYRLLGRLEGRVVGGRSRVGLIGEERLSSPFRTEFDRLAWRESARYRNEPFSLLSTELGGVEQPVLAVSADVGAAVRGGSPGHLRVGGAALSVERLLARGAPFAPAVAGDSAAAAVLAGRFEERRRVRLHLFVGARALRFRPHLGLDAVNAYEDVREGIEGGVVVGKSLYGGQGFQRDVFGSAEFYVGADVARMLVFARGKIEGRYLLTDRRWDGVLAEGGVQLYAAVGPRASVAVSASGSGGWNTGTPFQLLLGGPDGIRGYGTSSLPVGRRIVIQGEHRYFLGTVFGAADVGTAAFVDVGQGWAGDAPFGADTGMRLVLGAGLRFAVPRGSRRTYRLDIAVPLARGHGVEVQLAVNQQFGVTRGGPADLARSREQVSSTSIFDYPHF